VGEVLTGSLPEECRRTRPGTPMVGPYSVNQMDDFYAALARGEVKPTGVMNYMQHLLIAQQCPAGAHVVDVCCGRGLQLPVLYRYAPQICTYAGLDIAAANLAEARQRIAGLNDVYGCPFPVWLIECDVAAPWPDLPPADVIVYTSALEHLPREAGIASLRNAAAVLGSGGRLFLSTPNTLGDPPRRLQHRVHVYEWHRDELMPVLADAGLHVEELIGLLPPAPADLARALIARHGPGAGALYERLRACVPAPFADVVACAGAPEVATELLYVCRRKG
jgi:SAM-dependent methyltransferase